MGLRLRPNIERSDVRFIRPFPGSGRLPIAVLFGLLAACAICRAQESTAQRVEVYWHHDRTLAIAGITSVVVFDDSVCRAEFLGDKLRLIGSARGQTEVFVWTGERPQTLLVDVVEEPEKPIPPSLRTSADGASTATLGTSMRSAAGNGQPGGYTFFHRLWWQENVGEDHLTIQTQWMNATVQDNLAFNLNSGSIQYSTPSATFAFLDTNVNLGGGNQARITPYPIATSMMIRGVDLQLRRDSRQIEIFGGITPTPFFLNFTGARGIAGLTWTHILNPKLSVYSTTAATYVPTYGFQNDRKHMSSGFELAGGIFAVNERLKLQAGAGLSTEGPILEGAVSYVNPRLTAFANATYSSLNFPLNQLRLLPSGQTSGTAGLTSQVTSRMTTSLLYQHSSTQAGTLLGTGSSSDYLNASVSFALRPELHVTGNYVLNSTRGALSLAPRSIGNRGDLELSSQIGRRLNDSVRTTFGTLSDPFQYNSQDTFSVGNSANLKIGARDTLSFNASYDRTSAGLLSRLREDVYLLEPKLQALFVQDPVAF
jgi:hypothetical protein